MRLIIRLLLGVPFTVYALNSFARPLDATGTCPSGGALLRAEMHVDPRLMAEILRRAAQLPPWLSSVDLSKSTARLFRTANADIFVLTRCNPRNCEAERAYIGFAPRTVGWGASLYLESEVVELGRPVVSGAAQEIMPDEVAPAVICAQNLDWGN